MTQDTAIEAWVDRFRDDRDNQYVSEQHVQRAAAIIRLIGTSALSRGFAVPPPDDGDLLRMHREDVIWAHIVCATDDGVTFSSHVDGSRHTFTPELAMKIQHNLGSDIIMAFDQCSEYGYTHDEARAAIGKHDQRPLVHYDYLYLE